MPLRLLLLNPPVGGGTAVGELLPPQAAKKDNVESASSRTMMLRADITSPWGGSDAQLVPVNSEVNIVEFTCFNPEREKK